ncbi:hypothetical protein ABFS83_12G123500 [Erythranthe nasuta]
MIGVSRFYSLLFFAAVFFFVVLYNDGIFRRRRDAVPLLANPRGDDPRLRVPQGFDGGGALNPPPRVLPGTDFLPLHRRRVRLGNPTRRPESTRRVNIHFTQIQGPHFPGRNSRQSNIHIQEALLLQHGAGVMVMDLDKWREGHFGKKIENWMKLQRDKRIYELGSLPPFLLVCGGIL